MKPFTENTGAGCNSDCISLSLCPIFILFRGTQERSDNQVIFNVSVHAPRKLEASFFCFRVPIDFSISPDWIVKLNSRSSSPENEAFIGNEAERDETSL